VAREDVPAPTEVLHELAVVVDLAVLDDLDAPVLVGDRLVATGKVDDRETAHGEAARADDDAPVGVGAAVDQRLVHRGEGRGIRGCGPGHADATAYPAHGGESRERPGSGRGLPA